MLLKIVLVISTCAIMANSQFNQYEDDHQPLPYNFGYAIQDHHGAAHFRKEVGNGHGAVKGSYGFTDENGIRREVHYIADHNGFRARVKTNEPGTFSGGPADVHLLSSRHLPTGFQQY